MLRALPVAEPEGITFGIDRDFNKYCTRVYRCYFDPGDSDVYVGSNLPTGIAYHTPFPSYAGYTVLAIRGSAAGKCSLPGDALSLDGSGNAAPGAGTLGVRQWNLEVDYGPWTPLLGSPDGNPLNKPTTIRTTSQRTRRLAEQDKSGYPIVNTVGDPFNPKPERDGVANTLILEKNVQAIDLSVNLPYDEPTLPLSGSPPAPSGTSWVDCVNASQYGPFPPRSLKVAPVVFRQENHQTCGVYYAREVSLEIAPEGSWDLVVPNLSTREYDTSRASTGTDDYGNPTYPLKPIIVGGDVGEPAWIDASGKYLAPPVKRNDLVFLTFKVYQEIDFAAAFGPWSSLIPTGGGTG